MFNMRDNCFKKFKIMEFACMGSKYSILQNMSFASCELLFIFSELVAIAICCNCHNASCDIATIA